MGIDAKRRKAAAAAAAAGCAAAAESCLFCGLLVEQMAR